MATRNHEAIANYRYLLGYYMNYHYTVSALTSIKADMLQLMHQDINDMMPDIAATVDDVKAAWKNWFDMAANDGTLISSELMKVGYCQAEAIDCVLATAYKLIDSL